MFSRKINNVTRIRYTDAAAVMQVSGVPSRRIGANLLESSDGQVTVSSCSQPDSQMRQKNLKRINEIFENVVK
jgi:hypothetical protein